MENGTIRLTIPAIAECLDIVRVTLYSIACKAGFSYEEIEDMKVAVTEACTNAILHAYSDAPSGTIDLTFNWNEKGMHIRVKDKGISFEYGHLADKKAALHNTSLSEAAVGGLGIFMMQALMDKVEVITDGGTTVILTKHIRRNEEMV